jgi:gluconate 2-dehydrogenase gamma chain
MNNKNDETSPSRRRFLQRTLSLIPVAAIGSSGLSFSSHARAATQSNAESVTSQYVPSFFNDTEWQFILAATDRLIPADSNGPGAVSEGVPVFIDKQMELPYGHGHLWYMQAPFANAEPEMGYQSNLVPRDTYRRGIKAVNTHCHQQYKNAFADMSHDEQETVLHALEKGELTFDNVPGKLFFTQLLDNTKEGYFADPQHGGNQTLSSWKLLGFPGARADYQQVMDNPNKPYPLGPVSISGKRNS